MREGRRRLREKGAVSSVAGVKETSETGRTDVLHSVVEKDTAGTTVGESADLTARDVRGKLWKKGEDGGRNPEGMYVDYRRGRASALG